MQTRTASTTVLQIQTKALKKRRNPDPTDLLTSSSLLFAGWLLLLTTSCLQTCQRPLTKKKKQTHICMCLHKFACIWARAGSSMCFLALMGCCNETRMSENCIDEEKWSINSLCLDLEAIPPMAQQWSLRCPLCHSEFHPFQSHRSISTSCSCFEKECPFYKISSAGSASYPLFARFISSYLWLQISHWEQRLVITEQTLPSGTMEKPLGGWQGKLFDQIR